MPGATAAHSVHNRAMTSTPSDLPRRVTVQLVVGAVLLVAACLLGWWILVRGEEPFAIDIWWNALLVDVNSPVLAAISHAMDWIGGGWVAILVVPIGAAVALLIMRRPWSALFFIAAEAVSVVVVQVLKSLFGRVRPEEILVVSDYGSYPSGHVANAATIAMAAVVLFPRVWVMIVGAAWVLLMAFSRTYLHAHWLSDTVGGALVGVAAVLLVAAAFAVPLARERTDAASVTPG